MSRSTFYRLSGLRALEQLERIQDAQLAIATCRQVLDDSRLLHSYSQIAQEHYLSAPVVALMNATPRFSALVTQFPASHHYSRVPEHAKSVGQLMGMEALGESVAVVSDTLMESASGVVDKVSAVLQNLETSADDFLQQLHDASVSLSELDIADEAVASISVRSLSESSILTMIETLESHISNVSAFDFDTLSAHPDRIAQTAETMMLGIQEVGKVLGLTINEYGYVEAPKGTAYQPTTDTFASKDLTKTVLEYCLTKAREVCAALKSLGSNQQSILDSLRDAAARMPNEMDSDEITYGYHDHVCLFTSYATMLTKLVKEAFTLISQLVGAADKLIAISTDDNTVVSVV